MMPEMWMKGATTRQRINQWEAMTAEGRQFIRNHELVHEIYAELLALAKRYADLNKGEK